MTDDERSEVARKLREYARCEGAECLVYCENFGETVLNLFTGKCGESFRANYEYLADLIDNETELTCHDVTPWGDFFTCSECNGQVMLRPDVRWPDDGKILRTPTLIDGEGLGMRYPRFCPNCGAKVVDE